MITQWIYHSLLLHPLIKITQQIYHLLLLPPHPIDPWLPALYQRLRKWNLMLITTSPPPTILSHPFSLLTSPLGNWYGVAMMMILTQIPTTFTHQLYDIDTRLSALYNLQKLHLMLITTPSSPIIPSHPFSLLTKPLGNLYGVAMTMILPPITMRFITTMITFPNN